MVFFLSFYYLLFPYRIIEHLYSLNTDYMLNNFFKISKLLFINEIMKKEQVKMNNIFFKLNIIITNFVLIKIII
jgi:hypothetical protein